MPRNLIASLSLVVAASASAGPFGDGFDGDGFRPAAWPETRPASGPAEPGRLAPPPRRDDRVVPAEAIEFDGEPGTTARSLRPDDLLGVGVVASGEPVRTRSAALTVEKTAPARVAVGRPYVYAITVRNVGEEPASAVVVEDLVPRGTRLEGTSPRARMEGKTLVWDLADLAPGAERVVRVKVTPVAAGTVGSVATASFVSEVSSRTEVVAPELAMTVTSVEDVDVGEPVELRVTITNDGRADAADVLLRATLPPGVEHQAGRLVECSVGMLPTGQSRSVAVVVRSAKAGMFEIPVEAVAAGGLRVDAVARLTTRSTALAVTREQPREVVAGQIARSTTTVTNESDRPLDGGRLVERLPAGVTVISAPDAAAFDPASGTAAWSVGRLAPGESRSFAVDWAAADETTADGAVRLESPDGAVAELAPRFAVGPAPEPTVTTVSLDPTARELPTGSRLRLAGRVDPGATPLTRSGPLRIAIPTTLRLADAAGLPRLTASRRGDATVYFAEVAGPTEFALELVAERPGPAEVVVEVAGERAATPLTVVGPDGPESGSLTSVDFSAFE